MVLQSPCRLHQVEKIILEILLPGTKIPASSSYWVVRYVYGRPLAFRNYCRALKNLVNKKILEAHKDNKTGEIIYSLSQYGETIQDYLSPVLDLDFLVSSREYTTVFVSPERASEETKTSINSVKRKKIQYFHYLILCRKLYILKRVRVELLYKEIPEYPIVSNISELLQLIPKPPRKLIPAIERMNTGGGWLWPEIVAWLLSIGRYIRPKDESIKNKKQIKEVKDERIRL